MSDISRIIDLGGNDLIVNNLFTGSTYPGQIGNLSGNNSNISSNLSFRLFNGPFVNAGGSGQTYSVLNNLESTPVWVRLIHFNDQTGSTLTISGASISPTTSFGSFSDDGYNTYNSAGVRDDTNWIQVTYNNSGLGSLDPLSNVTGATVTAIVPAAASTAAQPSIYYSDWMPVNPLSRIDGGPGALLFTRVYSSGVVRYQGANNLTNINRAYVGHWKGGNFTAGTWPFASPGNIFASSPGIQYIIPGKGITILGVGDSITRGQGSTGTYSGYIPIAASVVSTPTVPVSYFCEGFSGRLSTDFIPDAYSEITTIKPQVVIIQMWSENDSVTQAQALTAFTNGMALAQYAAVNGAFPILSTAAPVFTGSPSSELVRVYSNNLVRNTISKGYTVLDLDAILGTGASPNGYKPAYNSGDNRHPSDAGNLAVAGVLKTILTTTVLPH